MARPKRDDRMVSVGFVDRDEVVNPRELEVTALVLDGKYVLENSDGDGFGMLLEHLPDNQMELAEDLMLQVNGPSDIQRGSSREMLKLRKQAAQAKALVVQRRIETDFANMAESIYAPKQMGAETTRADVIGMLRKWGQEDIGSMPNAGAIKLRVEQFKRDYGQKDKGVRRLAGQMTFGFGFVQPPVVESEVEPDDADGEW